MKASSLLFCSLLLVACGGAPATAPDSEGPSAATDGAADNVCGGNPCAAADEPAPAADDNDVYARAVGLFVEISDVMREGNGDCDQIAAGLNQWFEANGERRVKVMEELAERPEDERNDKFREAISGEPAALLMMEDTGEACQNNADFVQVFMKLQQ